jgi:hypothetical protein
MPRPSSITRIATAERSRTALSVGARLRLSRHDGLGRLDTVVDRVAQQVHDRIDLVEHGPVQLDVLSFDRRSTGPADLAASRTSRGKRSNTCHGHHAGRHDLVLQIGHQSRRLRNRFGQRRVVDRAGDLHQPSA